MAKDDIRVGLKVTLDEESVSREAERAGEKISKGAKGPRGGDRPSSFSEGMKEAVTRPLVDRLGKIEGKLANFGVAEGLLAGGAAAILAIKWFQDLYRALQAVLASLWNLARSLARFSPELSLSFREMSVNMRMMSIQLGQLMGKELANLVRAVTELVSLLFAVLVPAIRVLAALINLVTDAFRYLIRVVQVMAYAVMTAVSMVVRAVGSLLQWLGGKVPGLIGSMLQVTGLSMKNFADAVAKYANSILASANVGNNAVRNMNAAFIRGVSDIGRMAYSGVTAPGSGDERQAPSFLAPLKTDSHGTTRVYRGPQQSAASGRSAVQVQAPQLASVVNNVQLKTEVKLQHEEAVQRAIEEVRGCLVRAIHQVRNEQLNLSSRIYARTAIDL